MAARMQCSARTPHIHVTRNALLVQDGPRHNTYSDKRQHNTHSSGPMSIIHPATVIISGGTGSGKTQLTRSLLEHHRLTFANLNNKPNVLWCYGVYQPVFREAIPNVTVQYKDNLAEVEDIERVKPDILVVDDLMTEKGNDCMMQNLFTKLSHHKNVTVIFITQNIFAKGHCNLKRNAHYLIMMRNPSDKSQISLLGRQLYPRSKTQLEHFYESYDDATKQKYGYLFIDVSPDSNEEQKLKSNILPDSSGALRVTVYVLK